MMIGSYFRAVRLMHGLTLDEMSEIIGDSSASNLSRIEQNKQPPTAAFIDRFCARMHINKSMLMNSPNAPINDVPAIDLKGKENENGNEG